MPNQKGEQSTKTTWKLDVIDDDFVDHFKDPQKANK